MILSEVMRGSLCGFGKGHQISVKPWAEGMHPFAFLVRLKLADLTAGLTHYLISSFCHGASKSSARNSSLHPAIFLLPLRLAFLLLFFSCVMAILLSSEKFCAAFFFFFLTVLIE